MILLEVILTTLLVLAALGALILWATRPLWSARWQRHQEEERIARLALERAREQEAAEQRFRGEAAGEVETWSREPEAEETEEERR